MDETALATPLPVLPPCVRSLVDADLGLRTAIGTARFARGHDMSVLVPLAVAGPHVSISTPVGTVTDLVTGLTSPRTTRGLVRGIDGAGVRITGNMGGMIRPSLACSW